MTLDEALPAGAWPYQTEADQLIRLHDRLSALKPEQTRWLVREGVPPQSIVRPDPLRRGRVVFVDAARFEFEPDYRGDLTATEAVLMLAYEPDGCPGDMIAWDVRGNRLATWLGRVPWCGDAFAPRCSEGLALAVHESPLQWLRAGRSGVCLVEAAPGLCRQLDGAGPFLATGGPSHAARLKESLSGKPPKILVRKSLERAA